MHSNRQATTQFYAEHRALSSKNSTVSHLQQVKQDLAILELFVQVTVHSHATASKRGIDPVRKRRLMCGAATITQQNNVIDRF